MSKSRQDVDSLKEFDRQLEALQSAIKGRIDCTLSLSKKCDRAHIVIPGQPGQTVLRAMWGVLRKCQAFRENMHKTFYPTIAKFMELCKYIHNMTQLVLSVNKIVYVAVDANPTQDKINKFLSEAGADGIYVHIKNEKENRLFYANTSQCIELQGVKNYRIDWYVPFRKQALENPMPLQPGDFEHYVDITGYKPLVWVDKDVYEVLKAGQAFLQWLRADGVSGKYQFSDAKLSPVIEDFREAICIGVILKIVKPFLNDLPDDFSVTAYVDPNTQEKLSLNADLDELYNWIDAKIKMYEKACSSSSAIKETEEKKQVSGSGEVSSAVGFFKKEEKGGQLDSDRKESKEVCMR